MCDCINFPLLKGRFLERELMFSDTPSGESVAKQLPSDTRQWASIRDKGTQCCEAFWPEIWESSAPFSCVLKWTSISIQLTTYYQTKQPPRCEDSNLDYGASSSCWCCLAPPALAQMISKCLHEQRRYFLVSKSFLIDWWYLPSRFWPLCLRRCVRCPQWCELHNGWRYHMGHSNNQHHLAPNDSLPQLWCQWYCIRQEDQLFQSNALPPADPLPPPSCRPAVALGTPAYIVYVAYVFGRRVIQPGYVSKLWSDTGGQYGQWADYMKLLETVLEANLQAITGSQFTTLNK